MQPLRLLCTKTGASNPWPAQYFLKPSGRSQRQICCEDPFFLVFYQILEVTLISEQKVRNPRLKRRARDQHDHGSKPTRAILLCPWERHFTAYSPAWWS